MTRNDALTDLLFEDIKIDNLAFYYNTMDALAIYVWRRTKIMLFRNDFCRSSSGKEEFDQHILCLVKVLKWFVFANSDLSKSDYCSLYNQKYVRICGYSRNDFHRSSLAEEGENESNIF